MINLRVTHVSPLSCVSSVSPGHARLGHPKVYINLDKPEINFCGYCERRFVSEQNKNLFPEEHAVLLCEVIIPEVLFNNSAWNEEKEYCCYTQQIKYYISLYLLIFIKVLVWTYIHT